jgi:hypothetical protein
VKAEKYVPRHLAHPSQYRGQRMYPGTLVLAIGHFRRSIQPVAVDLVDESGPTCRASRDCR